MLVGIAVQFGRRSVDEDDVPVVGKLQDTVHVVRMELTDFVHHTVQLEVLELARSPFLEHVQQHDIHHGFDQDIRTLGAYVRKTFYEARIIPVLDHPEFKVEEVRQADQVAGISVHRLDQLT